ncbi:Two component regulator propeller [Thermoflexibacter ruber]|uniref:histidine kinase n=2 Tax=Thermoflexibacter ruber TaxID=1003 RepID=A0A1I2I6F3_9BACT|nr:Two component regulator propeller [Thermoflexibacter ruber]
MVSAIAEDNRGMIWLGTDRGLFKFDGRSFTEAKGGDSTILDLGEYLYITPQDKILGYSTWGRQITVYDIPTKQWARPDWELFQGEGYLLAEKTGQLFGSFNSSVYAFSYQNQKFLADTLVRFAKEFSFRKSYESLLKDKHNKNLLWGVVYHYLQEKYYLFSLDIVSKKHSLYPILGTDKYSVVDNLYQDEKGEIFLPVGINNQLFVKKFDKAKSELTDYFSYQFPANLQRAYLLHKSSHELWLYTGRLNGLYVFHTISPKITQWVASPSQLLPNTLIFKAIFQDSKGNLWIGMNTPTAPLMMIPPQLQQFQFYTLSQKIKDESTYNNFNWWVSALLEIPQSNRLYAGTYANMGLHVLDTTHRVIEVIRGQVLPNGKINNAFEITKIYKDRSGRIWVNARNGMYYLDTLKKQLRPYEKYAEMQKLIQDEVFYALYEDSEGYLWSGSRRHGVFRISPDRQNFIHYPPLPDKYETHFRHIIEHDKKIYIGSTMGMRVFDMKSKTFISKSELTFFDSIEIRGIEKDKKNQLWIGTRLKIKSKKTNPLYVYQPESKQIKSIPMAHLKKDLLVGHIIFDRNDDLWISFDFHLAKYDTKKEQFTFHDNTDFVEEKAFIDDPLCLLSNGKLLLGEEYGYYEWQPKEFLKDTIPPNIVLTKFQINNRDTIFAKELDFIKEITLPYYQNFISLSFSALSYTKPEKNQYAYQLVGYDKDWVQVGNNRTATYTNLPHGEYTFQVKASNHDGFWNEKGKSIKINILPPFWLTWWAYTFYALLVLGLALLARKLIIQRERLKASAELNALKSARLEEVDKLKNQFFSNISHEFRTPLTLIISPIEKLLTNSPPSRGDRGGTDETLKSDFLRIYRNAKRLLELINQLLDVAKLETGTMEVHTSTQNITIFLERLAANFHSLGQDKNVDFAISMPSTQYKAEIDSDKISKIVNNLISNAFKFTPEGGKVTFSAVVEKTEAQKGILHLRVSDTGIGIPKEQIDKIFDRFHQVESSLSRKYEGSGIGLALTKELIELLGGSIMVESEQEKGSTFWVQLPVKELLIGTQTTTMTISQELSVMTATETKNPLSIGERQGEGLTSNKKLPICLIVEDHKDMRVYLQECLQEKFHILLAENGKIGYAIAIKKLPDLIVTDVMMPIINGFELCKFLKENELTNHIPILMLTAKANPESKVEGIERGADAYLVKPFYAKELMATSINLVKQRRVLREKFGKEFKKQPLKVPDKKIALKDDVLSVDEKFMLKVKNIIEANLSNADFNNEQFAEAMNLSPSQLSRKLKATINQPPNDFVRTYRLHRAAEMLTNKTANVSEIAFQVGFENLSYFTKCFKEQFGKVPSEF